MCTRERYKYYQELWFILGIFDYFYFMCATKPIGGNIEQNAFLLQCIWICCFLVPEVYCNVLHWHIHASIL